MTKSMVVSPVTSFIFISPKINLGLGRDGIRIFGNGSYKCLIKDILCSNHQLFSENYLQHFAKFLKNTLHILFFGIPCRSSLQKYFVMIVFLVSSIHLHISRWDVRTTYFQASDWTVELYKRILFGGNWNQDTPNLCILHRKWYSTLDLSIYEQLCMVLLPTVEISSIPEPWNSFHES